MRKNREFFLQCCVFISAEYDGKQQFPLPKAGPFTVLEYFQ
jgi:hypothetical protein